MATSPTSTKRKSRPERSPKLIYRGIELPRLTIPPRLPLADIKRAVADAFAKRSAALGED